MLQMRVPSQGFIHVQRESSFVNLPQSRINERDSLREGLSRSGWAHPWGVVWTVRLVWEGPPHCEWYHSWIWVLDCVRVKKVSREVGTYPFLSALYWGVTSCLKPLLWLPHNEGLWSCTVSRGNPFLPHRVLFPGTCHSHRNEPRAKVHGWSNNVKIIRLGLGILLNGGTRDLIPALIAWSENQWFDWNGGNKPRDCWIALTFVSERMLRRTTCKQRLLFHSQPLRPE